VTIIAVFIAGFLLGLLGSYLPRELYVRSVVKQAVGCPCGREAGVLLMSVTRSGGSSHPLRVPQVRLPRSKARKYTEGSAGRCGARWRTGKEDLETWQPIRARQRRPLSRRA